MSKHTHRGTCQACGRVQAVSTSTGLLAKHGYSVEWGYFSGECRGSDELPLEVSTDVAREVIAGVAAHCEKLEARAADPASIASIAIDFKVDFRDADRKRVTVSSDAELDALRDEYRGRVPVYTNFAGLQHDTADRMGREAAHGRAFVADLEALIEKRHGADLIPVQAAEEVRRESADSYTAAQARKAELQADGWRVTVRRCRDTGRHNITAKRAA
ncbi:MAG: hypothetical protein ACU85V_00165 [Gammaproteobacteria bacterium]